MVLPQVLTYCGGVRPKIKNAMFHLNLQDLHVSYNPYQSFPKPVSFYFRPSFFAESNVAQRDFFYLNVIKKEIDKGEPPPAV